MSERKLVMATRNAGKIRELRRIIGDQISVELQSLDDFPAMPEIPETGDSFLANAGLKAHATAVHTGRLACADDSGLMVSALDGEPGVLSARYAGDAATDEENNQQLLDRLAGIEQRDAKFICACVLAVDEERLDPERFDEMASAGWWEAPEGLWMWAVEAEAKGYILESPRGTGGFGYDPLFYYPPLGKTFAEMSLEEKNRISHRGIAFRKMVDQLALLFGSDG